MKRWWIALALGALGCVPEPPLDCASHSDCASSEHCLGGRCVPSWATSAPELSGQPDASASPSWRDGGRDAGDASGAPTGPCDGAGAVQAGELILNEILVHVPPAPMGDANGDGARDAFEDEFVELVNVSARTLPLGGLSYASNGRVLGQLAARCLAPGHALVLFGGGRPRLSREGVAVEVAASRFAFSNTGGSFTLSDGPRGLVRYAYAGSRPEALRLEPELVGARYVPHGGVAPLSPGQCADGQPLVSGCPSSMEEVIDDMGGADQ